MKVAVLMSTYNGSKYIKTQIDSILNQEGDFDLNLIIRDDGSTDETIEILESYESDKRIKWYKGNNLKSARSFIDLIIRNPGYDFYAFSDQDDFWESNKLNESIKVIKNENVPSIIYSNAELVDYKLDSLGKKLYKKEQDTSIYTVMCAANIIGCTMVFNEYLSKKIMDAGMPGVITMHDSYLARVCLAIGGKVHYKNEVYTKYRQHTNNVLGVKTKNIDKIKLLIKDIITKSKTTIDMQAREILDLYSKDMSKENKKWIIKICDYNKNVINRFLLAISLKPRYTSLSLAIRCRLAILLGNR